MSFSAHDEDGNTFELVSILEASPEFINALANEQPSIPCSEDMCREGWIVTPVLNNCPIHGIEIGFIRERPCVACMGRGFLYAMCPN